MKFRLKWKDIRPDPERDLYIFDSMHPTSKESIHVEQKAKTSIAYDHITADIDALITQINKLRETEIEVEIMPPFQVSVMRKRTAVTEQKYSETVEISE